MRASLVTAALGTAVLAVSLVACTGSDGSGPASASGESSSAKSTSAPGQFSCQPLTEVRSYDRHVVVTNALQVGLAPDASRENAVLPPVRAVQATTSGGSAGDDLWALVGRHFGTTVARAGQQIGTGDAAYTGTVLNHNAKNASYIIYQVVRIYTGEFAATCSGRRSSGTYTTFGAPDQGFYDCDTTSDSDIATMAKTYCT